MYSNLVSRCFTVFCLILLLIPLGSRPGFCQDRSGSNSFGPGFHILPITRELAQMPMPISFNGISSANPYSQNNNNLGGTGMQSNRVLAGVRLSMPAPGINAGLSRIRKGFFKYIQVAGPDLPGKEFTSAEYGTGPVGDTGDITLEIQADITDMSGALFLIMKI